MIKYSGNNSACRHNTYLCFLLKNIYSNSTHILLKKKKKTSPLLLFCYDPSSVSVWQGTDRVQFPSEFRVRGEKRKKGDPRERPPADYTFHTLLVGPNPRIYTHPDCSHVTWIGPPSPVASPRRWVVACRLLLSCARWWCSWQGRNIFLPPPLGVSSPPRLLPGTALVARPRLILLSVSGFAWRSPYQDNPSYTKARGCLGNRLRAVWWFLLLNWLMNLPYL
jgi:hypothetical protein